jgi:ABC-type branched-subunit amino acid transport system ATPase component
MLLSRIKNNLRSFFYLLDNKDKLNFFKVIILAFTGSLLEFLSIGAIAPVIILIINDDVFAKYPALLTFEYLSNFNKQQLISYSIILIVFVYLVKFIFLSIIKINFADYIFKLQKKLSNKLFFKYLLSDYNFHLQNNSSKLLRNIISVTNDFTQGLTVGFLNFFLEINLFILVFILLCFLSLKFTILILFFLTLSLFFYFIFFKKPIEDLGYLRVKKDGYRLKEIKQSLEGIKQIKMFNKENLFYNVYEKLNSAVVEVTRKLFIYQNLTNYIFEFFGVLLFGGFILYFQHLKYPNEQLLISIAILSIVLFRLIPGVSRIVLAVQTIYSHKYSLAILVDEFRRSTKINPKKKKIIFKNTIHLKNISLSYSGKNIFENSNIFFEKNKITSIVGKSGSGKSSLINILTGLILPDKGFVYIGGSKVKDFVSLREDIGFISQDNFLIDDAIQNNIAVEVDKKKINFKKLIEASKQAEIYKDIVSMPNQFSTSVGERGSNLSGGQQQRISIARAMYKDNHCLIFDEATSSLDKKTELLILKTIVDLKKIKTIIFISHDLNIVKKISDRIFEIKNNKIFKLK